MTRRKDGPIPRGQISALLDITHSNYKRADARKLRDKGITAAQAQVMLDRVGWVTYEYVRGEGWCWTERGTVRMKHAEVINLNDTGDIVFLKDAHMAICYGMAYRIRWDDLMAMRGRGPHKDQEIERLIQQSLRHA